MATKMGSFTITTHVQRVDTISYARVGDLEQTPYFSGTDILDLIRSQLGYTVAEVEKRIRIVQIFGKEKDIHIKCRSPNHCPEMLAALPTIRVKGMESIGSPATPEIYDHRPKVIKVFLRQVLMTMEDEDILRELRKFCYISPETQLKEDMYSGEYTNIGTGGRIIYVKQIYSKAGLPLRLSIKGFSIFVHHYGQEKNFEKHRGIIWKENQERWQQREQERREREKENIVS